MMIAIEISSAFHLSGVSRLIFTLLMPGFYTSQCDWRVKCRMKKLSRVIGFFNHNNQARYRRISLTHRADHAQFQAILSWNVC